jgi:hypothetical protein
MLDAIKDGKGPPEDDVDDSSGIYLSSPSNGSASLLTLLYRS